MGDLKVDFSDLTDEIRRFIDNKLNEKISVRIILNNEMDSIQTIEMNRNLIPNIGDQISIYESYYKQKFLNYKIIQRKFEYRYDDLDKIILVVEKIQ